jgi:hypothetical protein
MLNPSTTLLAAGAAAVAAATILTAAPAGAAPVSDFLTQVREDGIAGPDDSLIAAARQVCAMLNYEDGKQVAQYVYQQSGLTDWRSAEKFTIDAATYFCPWQYHGGQTA